MITVSPLNAVPGLVQQHRFNRVLGLLGPDIEHPDLGLPDHQHLRMTFNDISTPMKDLTPPGREHMQRIIGFIEDWDLSSPMLIHCWAGISRSTASAFITMCLLNPQEEEIDLAWELRHIAPSATPNRLMVEHADAILRREGRMISAIRTIGRGVEAWEGDVFNWDVKRR
jgi:predicted protein tyrosine phosphatase